MISHKNRNSGVIYKRLYSKLLHKLTTQPRSFKKKRKDINLVLRYLKNTNAPISLMILEIFVSSRIYSFLIQRLNGIGYFIFRCIFV